MLNNCYRDKHGNYLLLKSFCAYFDVLGFQEKILNEEYGYFNTYLKILQQQIELIEKESSFQEVGFFELKIFTDNFVLGYPWRDQFGESELGALFRILSRLQFTFACKDIFIRGAITLGDLYMDNNIVLGKALLEAYNLEIENAIHPRIILSELVLNTVNEHINYYRPKTTSPQYREYLIDIDGLAFLNYLLHSIESSHGNLRKTRTLIEKHKTIVLSNLEKYRENHKLFQKFSWLGEYHNYFCDNFLPLRPGTTQSLKIEEKLLKKSLSQVNILS